MLLTIQGQCTTSPSGQVCPVSGVVMATLGSAASGKADDWRACNAMYVQACTGALVISPVVQDSRMQTGTSDQHAL